MKSILFAALLISAAGGVFAQSAPQAPTPKAAPVAVCDECGTVQQVKQKEQKTKTSKAGMVGGAVVGGVIGHQLGGGTGKTLATIGGAAAGGYVGEKAEQKHNAKVVWVTTVKLKDGSVKTFEQEAKPFWTAGNVVKVSGNKLEKP
jgi:outer membrane lipoprotein SlyB